MGACYYKVGNYDKAIPALEKSKATPFNFYMLGLSLIAKNKNDEALHYFNSAIEYIDRVSDLNTQSFIENITVKYGLKTLTDLQNTNKTDDSKKALKSFFYNEIGKILAENNDYANAIAAYKKIQCWEYDYAINFAKAYENIGDHKNADKYYKKAKSVNKK